MDTESWQRARRVSGETRARGEMVIDRLAVVDQRKCEWDFVVASAGMEGYGIASKRVDTPCQNNLKRGLKAK